MSITGPKNGIGAATPNLFAKRRARVVSTDLAYPANDEEKINFDANPARFGLDVRKAYQVRQITLFSQITTIDMQDVTGHHVGSI